MSKKKAASKKVLAHPQDTASETLKKIYESTSPLGIKPSASLPKVQSQKRPSSSTLKSFTMFSRYLKYKFGDIPEQTEVPALPAKRPNQYTHRNIYDLLSLSPGSDISEVKRSYRKLAIVHHPDKGGDPLRFKCLNKAYEILSDEGLRQIYDNEGFEGVKNSSEIDTSELEGYLSSNYSL